MNGRRLRTVAAVARVLTLVVAGALAVATAAPGVGAHDDGTTAHLWTGHLEPMGVPGTINDAANPVDWTKLKNVPPQVADGNDKGVESAGLGLLKFGSLFSVDPAVIQRRLARSCTIGQSMRAISASGSPTCNAGPDGVSLRIADTGPMCNNDCTEGTLILRPGTWAFTAQIVVRQSDAGTDWLWVDCHFDAGGKSDKARYRFKTSGAATVPMQLIATLTGNTHATVNCGDGDIGEVVGSGLSIVAVRLAD
jgi:hypothetical protein